MGDARADAKAQKDRSGLEKMRIAKHGDEDAQHSVTYYAVVDKVTPRLAWLSMKPITGRTHQLRAHAEAIGHPIIGDPKYSGAANDPRGTIPRGKSPTPSSTSCIFSRAGSYCRIRAAARLT